MNVKEATTMCLYGTAGGLIFGWAAGRPEWMYSLAAPSRYAIAELGLMVVGSLLLIRVSRWLIKNLALSNSN